MINTYGILWEQIKGGEEVFWFKKKGGKPKAAIFVDYEHWYYGYNNIFSMKPNVEEWYEELTEEYSVKNIVFFGDFHGNSIEKELPRLEKITKNVVHTASTKDGVDKDFTPIIEKALELGGYDEDKQFTGINGGTSVTTGFGHGTIFSVADKVIDAVKSGAIKHFFLVGGCDGARAGRNYYTDFVKQTPDDTIILTLACGKYRFNDLDLGTIGGLPRIMDMGQCNDAYGAIKVAIALAEAFECEVNELPLSMILSWYEQKAVCILLTLLHLGIKNIRLGPTLPAFISPNVLGYLVENYNIAKITTPEEDLKNILG